MNLATQARLFKRFFVTLLFVVSVVVSAAEDSVSMAETSNSDVPATAWVDDCCASEDADDSMIGCDNCQHCQSSHSNYQITSSLNISEFEPKYAELSCSFISRTSSCLLRPPIA